MTRVIKIGGRAQGDPRLSDALRLAARRRPGAPPSAGAKICVVHGGGDEVSALQRRLGLEPKFRGGRRVTSAEDLEVVRMVLSGTINKRLVSLLLGQGVPAVGISGEDGGLFTASATDPAALGRVGGNLVVKADIVLHLLCGGFIPVISPVARETGEPGTPAGGLNVNGDDAAAALAASLGADELVLVADVPGVMHDGVILPSLDVVHAGELIANGVAVGGMAAKLEAAAHALLRGVLCVRIAGLDGIHDEAAGTKIVLSHTSV